MMMEDKPPLAVNQSSGDRYTCPKCGSEHVTRAELVYESGVSTSESQTTAVGVGAGMSGAIGGGVGSASSSTASQTALAKRIAPPEKRPVAGVLFAPILLLAVLWGCCAGTCWIGILDAFEDWMTLETMLTWSIIIPLILYGVVQILGILAAVENRKWNQNEWPTLYAHWQRRWLCRRCGEVFEIADAETNRTNGDRHTQMKGEREGQPHE